MSYTGFLCDNTYNTALNDSRSTGYYDRLYIYESTFLSVGSGTRLRNRTWGKKMMALNLNVT